MPMNRFIASKVVCCEPVADSPEACVSALPRPAPLRPNRETNAGGNAPPLLKKVLIALATFC